MSNLKKVVSLALVLIMVVSMGASAAAAFSDKDDINFTDEVNLLTSLGVISGYPDGSFKPAGSVTRAEYAKMLFMVKLGHLDASGFVNGTTTFTDLDQAAWAKGYIKYLSSVGVIAGKSADKFDPNGQITGYEAVKMLLVVLGYKADQAKLIGSSWKLNTLTLGVDRGLLDDYDKDFDAPATRELAALLIVNALDAVCVKYSGLSIDLNGNLTADIVDESRNADGDTVLTTLGWKAFGLCYETGYLVETNHMASIDNMSGGYFFDSDPDTVSDPALAPTDDDTFSIMVTGSTYGDKADLLTELLYEDLDESLIGQEVTVSFKEASNGDLEVYGVIPTGKSKTYASALVDTKFDGAKLTIKVDGTTKEFKDLIAADAVVDFVVMYDGGIEYVNGDLSAFAAAAKAADGDDIAGGLDIVEEDAGDDVVYEYAIGKNAKMPGNVMIVDMDGDGDPDYGYVTIGTFGRVDVNDEADEEFELVGDDSYEFNDDDFDKISGEFAVGDYCFATVDLAGDIKVVPAEKVTLKPTKTTSDKVYVGDTAYYCYAGFAAVADFDFDTTYTVYTNGAFIAKKSTDSTEAVAVDDIALATYIDTRLKVVKLLNAEGDEEIYNYTNKNDDDVIEKIAETIADTDFEGEYGLVKFAQDDAGDVKLSELKGSDTIKAAANTNFVNGGGSTNDYITIDGSTTKYYLDASSKIFIVGPTSVVDGEADFDVFTRADLKNEGNIGGDYTTTATTVDPIAGTVVYRSTSSGYRYVVAVSVKSGDDLPTTATDDKFVFLTADASKWRTTDGNFFSITGQSVGEAVSYTSEDLASSPTLTAKKFDWVKISLNSDGEIDSATLNGNDLLPVGGLNELTYETTAPNDVVVGALAAFDDNYESMSFYEEGSKEDNKRYLEYDFDDDTKIFVMNSSGVMTAGTADDLHVADYNSSEGGYYILNSFYRVSDTHIEFIVISNTNRLSSIDGNFNWAGLPYVSSITVTGATGATTITTLDGILQMNAAVTPTNAVNKTVTWSVTPGATGTASISSTTGLLTALTNGTVTVTATANDGSGIFGTQVITLSNQVAVSSITVTGATGATVAVAGTLQMSAAVLPANADNAAVTWTVTPGATGTATISATGLLTPATVGTVTVTATANDGSGITGTLEVTIS